MKEKDNGVIFLKDWLFLIDPLSDENKLVFWNLFTTYEYGEDRICENQFVAPTWNFIKKQLDNMRVKYQENVIDRNKRNGSKGGRPRKESQITEGKTINPTEPNRTEEIPNNPLGYFKTQITPNNKDNVKDNNKDKDKDNVNDILLKKESKEENITKEISEELFREEGRNGFLYSEDLKAWKKGELEPIIPDEEKRKKVPEKKEKSKRVTFSAPSVQAVQDYCNERQNGISGYSFVNFYQSKGWMVGSNKMKDWKAAVRTWEQKNKEDGKSNSNNTNNGFNNKKGNSSGSTKISGKVSARVLLARELKEKTSGDSESGDITIDAEIVE